MKKVLFSIMLVSSYMMTQAENNTVDSTDVYQIEAVSVKSYRNAMKLKDAPNKIEVISLRDIKNNKTHSLTDIIKNSINAESVDMQGLTSSFEFRGYTPSATGMATYSRLLVDGVPYSTRGGSISTLNNATSIEVVKGPFSAIYGSGAMGGVVNIISAETRGKIAGFANVGYGSYNTFYTNASVGGNITKKLDFDLSFGYYNQNNDYKVGSKSILCLSDYDKIVLDPNSKGATYSNTKFNKVAANIRLGYDLSKKWRINLYSDIFDNGKGRGNGSLWGLYDLTDKKVNRHAHRIDLKGKEGRHSLRFTPFFSKEASNYDNFSAWGDTESKNSYMTWGIQAQDAITFGNQVIIFGIDNFSQKYTSKQWNDKGAGIAPWQPDYINIQNGVFLQGNLSFLDNRLTSVVGLRYDNTLLKTYNTPFLTMKSSTKNFSSLNPNVAVKYKLPANLNVHASVGRAYLAPDAFKMTGEYSDAWGGVYKGNPDLKAESSVSYDFGIGYENREESILADVTMFSTNHKNLIVTDYSFLDKGYYTYKNANKSIVNGLEFMLQGDIAKMMDKRYSLRIYGSYTHIFKSDVTIGKITSPKKYLSRNLGNFGAEFQNSIFSLRINARYVGERIEDNFICAYDNNSNRIPLKTADGKTIRPSLAGDPLITVPQFLVFDAALNIFVYKGVTVGAKLNNILDERYMERDGYYMQGRNFSVDLSYKF